MARVTISTPTKVLREAKSLGYKSVYIPKSLRKTISVKTSAQRVTIAKKSK